MTFGQVPTAVASESVTSIRQAETKTTEAKTKETVEFVQRQVLKIKETSHFQFSGIPQEEAKSALSDVVITIKQPDPLKELKDSLKLAEALTRVSAFFGFGALLGAFLLPSLMFGMLGFAGLFGMGALLGLGLKNKLEQTQAKDNDNADDRNKTVFQSSSSLSMTFSSSQHSKAAKAAKKTSRTEETTLDDTPKNEVKPEPEKEKPPNIINTKGLTKKSPLNEAKPVAV